MIVELAERAKKAEQLAAEKARAEAARMIQPVATVRLGRNPTFLRLQFDWSVDTGAEFAFRDERGTLTFDWPVPIDLYPLKADVPPEFKGAANAVTAAGSRVTFEVAEGVVPRFYKLSPRQYVVDIDTSAEEGLKVALAAEEEARKARTDAGIIAAGQNRAGLDADGVAPGEGEPYATPGGAITPIVSTVGNTIRVSFPFDEDTAAAVFRRGDTVWMVFDTTQSILPPPPSEALAQVASKVEVLPAGETKVVRMDLAVDRLATLGSEGRSWVLSLGDVLLNATEPMQLTRERNREGHLEMAVNLDRPGKLHVLRDPVVGDILDVVTVLPPARGLVRNLSFVDFDALRSAHGLVIRPRTDNLGVEIADNKAVISVKGGLTLSAVESVRSFDAGNAPQFRESYLDLAIWREEDPLKFSRRREEIIARAAGAEGRLREVARLELGQFLIGNEFSFEAIGVLKVLEDELRSEDLRKKLRLSRAIADTAASRPAEALGILNSGTFPEETDALMWRAVARAEAGDFAGARADAVAADAASTRAIRAGYATSSCSRASAPRSRPRTTSWPRSCCRWWSFPSSTPRR